MNNVEAVYYSSNKEKMFLFTSTSINLRFTFFTTNKFIMVDINNFFFDQRDNFFTG